MEPPSTLGPEEHFRVCPGLRFRQAAVGAGLCEGYTMNTDHCIEICNKLLRGERSAVEAYDQAIEKSAGKPVVGALQHMREDHVTAVGELEENVRSMGGEPGQDSGAWGVVATTVQGTANLIGEDAALESLQTGEKAGRSDYEGALEDDEVMPECKDLIRSVLLPKVVEHIARLDSLQKAA